MYTLLPVINGVVIQPNAALLFLHGNHLTANDAGPGGRRTTYRECIAGIFSADPPPPLPPHNNNNNILFTSFVAHK